jgi:hypothetical protein
VVGIRLETNESRFREQVGYALHTLARHPHSACDLGNGASGSDSHENFPASPGLLLQPGNRLPPRLVQAGQGEGFLQNSLRPMVWHL